MFGDGLPRCIKVFGNSVGRHCLEGYKSDDGPSCRVGDGLKYISSHFFPITNPNGCKYMRSQSVSQIFLKKDIRFWIAHA